MTAPQYPFLQLNRLCVFKAGGTVYDELFHNGLNIIRGENGSGKSTVTDLIFYVLGGESIKWKPEPLSCDYVVAEVNVSGAILTLRRDISENAATIMVFNGDYSKASATGFEGWQAYSPNRARAAENELNFSQIMFEALGVPEAAASGSSNLTMHQILRLLYCDQMQSPVQRIFRFERFDQPDTRASIGDLLMGVGGVDLYEKIISRRELEKEFYQIEGELRNLLNVVKLKSISISTDQILGKINENKTSIDTLIQQLEALTSDQKSLTKYQKDQEKKGEKLASELSEVRERFSRIDIKIKQLDYEIADDNSFVIYLNQSLRHLSETETTHEAIGAIQFEYCPSCLTPLNLKSSSDDHICYLCKGKTDQSDLSNRILNIKIDFSSQLKETEFLIREKQEELTRLQAEKIDLFEKNRRFSREYDLQTASTISSYEAKVSEISERVGYLKAENENLQSYLVVATEIDRLSTVKAQIQSNISKLDDAIKGLELSRERRRAQAKSLISKICVELLQRDLNRQEQFSKAGNVDFSFKDDVVMVDGTSNFSASGIVVLKNSFHLALLLASATDHQFRLPRFMLMDTTEDKGMEEARSQRFQENVAEFINRLQTPNQFILTTSMISPKLEQPQFVIGRKYSRQNKTLQFAKTEDSKEYRIV